MDRSILHCDMNSCYASIEALHHPELRSIPIAVGGSEEKRHGIILAKDETAKKAGVKTGMALWQARRLCPGLVILPPRMELYSRFSQMLSQLYGEYTNLIEPFGLDEAWLDVTQSGRAGEAIAHEIRERVKTELGVTVSVGVSWNKVFAKLGSDYKKPDAVTVIDRRNVERIVWPLPVDELLFVGRSTGEHLHSLGIHSIGQLARCPVNELYERFGKSGYVLHSFASGEEDSPVSPEGAAPVIKSIGNSTTGSRDLKCDRDAYVVLLTLAESVGMRLRENGFECSVVEISVRDSSLHWFTRQRKLPSPTDVTDEILQYAYELFRKNWSWKSTIRSLGIRGASLVPSSGEKQLCFLPEEEQRLRKRTLDGTVDDIRRRFGFDSIQRCAVLSDRPPGSLNAKDEHAAHPVSSLYV